MPRGRGLLGRPAERQRGSRKENSAELPVISPAKPTRGVRERGGTRQMG